MQGSVALLAGLLIALSPGHGHAEPSPSGDSTAPPPAERVVLVELRSGDETKLTKSRATLAAALNASAGISVSRTAELDAALAGVRHDPARAQATNAIATARTAYGRLDCKAVGIATSAAIDILSGMQASGASVSDDLRTAYAYRLLCADSAGRRTDAMSAAAQLRNLGGEAPPAGIGAAVWARYPAVDAATNVLMSKLTVTGPAAAKVWIDHKPRGVAPVTVVLARGAHRIAVATSDGYASRRYELTTDDASIALTPAVRKDPWKPVRERVAGWRKPGGSPSRAGLAALMKDTGVRFAVVLAGNQAGVWGVRDAAPVAQRVGIAAVTAPDKLATLVSENARAFDGRRPAANTPLLVEKPDAAAKRKRPQKWWVYASIIGAVAVGAGIIAARDLATDRQRIELTWP